MSDNHWQSQPIEFTVEGGSRSIVTIPAPRKGRLGVFVMEQTGGTPVNGEFQLYSSKDAALANTDNSLSAAPGGPPPSLSQIMPDAANFTAGNPVRLDVDYLYENKDGDLGHPKFEFYMTISTDGAGDCLFAVSFTVRLPTEG